jgi:hypothetical protein
MAFDPEEILSILDRCCDSGTFPMLDNGYFYLARTRLSLYLSNADWAMVIEVFGFSPRAGLPHTLIETFASRLYNREPPAKSYTQELYQNYLALNPHNEFSLIDPISEGTWQDAECDEFVADDAAEISVRGQAIRLPEVEEYARHGIELQEPPRVQVFELCRYLADVARDQVLATPQEQRGNILPDMDQVLQLDEWHHPDLLNAERPSRLETFQQLASVLAYGDPSLYRPSQSPNTHWRNWPEGGSL